MGPWSPQVKVYHLGPLLLVNRWSRRWVTLLRFFLDLKFAKAPDGGRIHRRHLGSSLTDPIVMSDSVGSQLHAGFGVLGNHDVRGNGMLTCFPAT
jgi:hypothetical protein